MDGTSPKVPVPPRNHLTWLTIWHFLFLLFSISSPGELCSLLCSILIYSATLVFPRGNITISFNSLAILWYHSGCLNAIGWPALRCLSLQLSWGSWRRWWFCKMYSSIIWVVIAISISVRSHICIYKSSFTKAFVSSPACYESWTVNKMWSFLLSLLSSSAILPSHGHGIH